MGIPRSHRRGQALRRGILRRQMRDVGDGAISGTNCWTRSRLGTMALRLRVYNAFRFRGPLADADPSLLRSFVAFLQNIRRIRIADFVAGSSDPASLLTAATVKFWTMPFAPRGSWAAVRVFPLGSASARPRSGVPVAICASLRSR